MIYPDTYHESANTCDEPDSDHAIDRLRKALGMVGVVMVGDALFVDGVDVRSHGVCKGDDFWNYFEHHAKINEALAQIAKPKRQHGPRLKDIERAKKTGATSVTRNGVTYTLGSGIQVEPQTSPDDELKRWRKKHAR